MSSSPRSIPRFRKLVSLVLLLALTALPVGSQQPRRRAGASSPAQVKEAERARRTQALGLLAETAERARSFKDLSYRVRIQVLAADALWSFDVEQARAVFRRAWEAAAAADRAEEETLAREAGTPAAASVAASVTEARDEVLAAAALRDPRLGELFLRELLGERDEAKGEKQNAARNEALLKTAGRGLSAGGTRRLALAAELLQEGETRNAALLAAPVVNEGAGPELLAFILQLRERSAGEADALYLRLLERAAADARTDANAVLLLSSFIISPGLLVAVNEYGSLEFRPLPPTTENPPAPPSQELRTAFFNLAASVLLRPLPPLDAGRSLQQTIAGYYAIGRLLPFFEQPAAQSVQYVGALRARQSELFNEIEAGRREQVSAQFEVQSLSRKGASNPLGSLTEQLARAGDAERDRLRLSIVKTAVRNSLWDRARRAAAEIEATEQRRAALSFVAASQIANISPDYADEQEPDVESIAKFVRGADVPPLAKAWGLAQAALIAARLKRPGRSQQVARLLNEGERYAARVRPASPQSVAAYGVLTLAAARVAPPSRAWALLSETVRAANAAEDYAGDEAALDIAADENPAGAGDVEFSVEAEVFRLDGIFATIARMDFEKALAEARALRGEVPQAFASIAIARSVLEPAEK
ncbi:MAG TPA: hypothetical protein VF723_16600 [Pyrinomonadaceae bacterium]|jgi:hypothetical protein